MELDFDKVVRIKKIRMEKSCLSEEEQALSQPLLTDKGEIKVIYDIFVDILENREPQPNINSVIQRKKFIFIVLYLFSVGTLLGGKMPNGLREELSNVLGVKDVIISNNCKDIVFQYQNYIDFSDDVNVIYAEIVRRLKAKGMI